MKCPYCNQELRDGYIPASSIEWIPQYDEPHIRYKQDKSNGFRIGSHSFGNMKKQPACYCGKCNVIIIDCSIENAEKF